MDTPFSAAYSATNLAAPILWRREGQPTNLRGANWIQALPAPDNANSRFYRLGTP